MGSPVLRLNTSFFSIFIFMILIHKPQTDAIQYENTHVQLFYDVKQYNKTGKTK